MPKKRDDDWVQVEFWGGSKDGEHGLFRDVELSTNDDIILIQKDEKGRIVGEEKYVAGPLIDFIGSRPQRRATFKEFRVPPNDG